MGTRNDPNEGAVFRRAREDANVSLGDLARELCVSVQQLSDWERGRVEWKFPAAAYWALGKLQAANNPLRFAPGAPDAD